MTTLWYNPTCMFSHHFGQNIIHVGPYRAFTKLEAYKLLTIKLSLDLQRFDNNPKYIKVQFMYILLKQTLILARTLEQGYCVPVFHHTRHGPVEIKTVERQQHNYSHY